MLTPVLEEAGLGFFLDKNNPGYFEHNGTDEGFQAILTMNAESGKGIAIMSNSDKGITVGNFLLQSVAKEYGWNYKLTEHRPFPALVLIAKLKGTQAALERYRTEEIPVRRPQGCRKYAQRAGLHAAVLGPDAGCHRRIPA